MLDPALLQAYINTFYGYGTYTAPFWFIGKEEGGGHTPEEIQHRLTVWNKRKQQELEDLAEYHRALGAAYLFRENPPLQPTWNKLMRTLFSIRHYLTSTNNLRKYQREKLGIPTGESALLELLPLPARSTKHWLYTEPIGDRDVYKERYAQQRADHLRQRIEEYRPEIVMFYSTDHWYRHWWEQIAGVSFRESNIVRKPIGGGEHIVFAVMRHPTSLGITNDYFEKIGKSLADKLS